MKKLLVITGIFIAFLFIYFLQINFFTWYNIHGIKPNLFIVFSLFLGLFLGKKQGFALGIIFGLLLDFFIGQNLGINAIALGLVGLLGGILDKNFSKDKRITLILMTMCATLICEFIIYILKILINNAGIEITQFLQITTIEILFNTLLVIIIYPLLQKTGEKIENVFEEDRFGKFR